jgi:glucose/arabinose dehydrogenase
VREGPDGALYLLTDASPNGRLLRVTPGGRETRSGLPRP